MKKLGVIIGRFQVASLTEGHMELISSAKEASDEVLVLVGCSHVPNSRRNPLSFSDVKSSILKIFPTATVWPLHDRRTDQQWAKKIDEIIFAYTEGAMRVLVHGGRDSSVASYHNAGGVYPIYNHGKLSIYSDSGTEARKKSLKAHSNTDIRIGKIQASHERYKNPFPTVDAVVFKGEKVLLGRKNSDPEGKCRLIGGFVDLEDDSFESAIKREVREETNCEISQPFYLGSRKIDDWRMRGDPDHGIITVVFGAQYVFGDIQPKDDIIEAKWVDRMEAQGIIIDEHKKLLEFYNEHRKLHP